MSKNLKTQWRVEYRKSRKHAWGKAGLFETRKAARDQAVYMRYGRVRNGELVPNTGWGFGNTRVTKYIKA